jgi:hypothetical protein
MRPTDPDVLDHWYSGFLLFGRLFGRAGDSFLQEACTLFCMGAVLAVLTYWTRAVWLAVGLHAGWVWVMMLFRLYAENRHTMTWLYGASDWISRGWIGPIMAAAVWLAALRTRRRWIAMGSDDA